jgi:hypothetical protein
MALIGGRPIARVGGSRQLRRLRRGAADLGGGARLRRYRQPGDPDHQADPIGKAGLVSPCYVDSLRRVRRARPVKYPAVAAVSPPNDAAILAKALKSPCTELPRSRSNAAGITAAT